MIEWILVLFCNVIMFVGGADYDVIIEPFVEPNKQELTIKSRLCKSTV